MGSIENNLNAFTLVCICILSIFFPVVGSILNIKIQGYLLAYILSFSVIFLRPKFIIYNRYSSLRFFILLLFVYVLYTYKYTISYSASQEKIIYIFYSIIIPLLIIALTNSKTKDKLNLFIEFEKKLVKVSRFLIIISFLLFIIGFKDVYEPGRVSLQGMINPIWACRTFAFLLLILTINRFEKRGRGYQDIICICLALFLIIKTGSRGPLLSYMIVTAILITQNSNFKHTIKLLAVTILSIIIVFYFIGGRMFDTSLFSIIGRFDYITFALDNVPNLIWGNGVGSFGIIYYGVDEISYPHNIFVELFFEGGFIGITIFILILYLFFHNIKLNYLSIITIYYLINSQFSGDISSNNFLFIFLFIYSYLSPNMVSNTINIKFKI